MIDQIKNKTLNSSVSNVKNTTSSSNEANDKVQKVDNPSKSSQIKDFDGKVSQFITKEKIKSMSKEPPIDTISTTRIKEAIKQGNYPLDMSKVADALFKAFKEMK
tara:strand:- start:324 stop:638 length:315 start_codon:yes stop_codon:yes gene_type:complete